MSDTEQNDQTPSQWTLPPEIAAAVTAARPQLIDIFAARIDRGEVELSKEHTLGLLRIVKEFIQNDVKNHQERIEIKRRIAHATQAVLNVAQQTEKVREVLDYGIFEHNEDG